MKAIHNLAVVPFPQPQVGNYKLKYNFESNSQHFFIFLRIKIVGNYKLKYNFESNSQPKDIARYHHLVGNYKLKYNFESNSQPTETRTSKGIGW